MGNYEVIVTPEAGVIKCDFDSAKKYLDSQLDIYRGMVFTEDSKKDAKNTVAELRKQKKAFSDRVKEVKAEYMKPFDEFQKQANELIGMYDEPVDFINGQVEAFEQKRITEKKQRIADIYQEFIGDMAEKLPLNAIYNIKWENATFTEKQIKDEINEIKASVKTGIETIKAMQSDIEERVIDSFLVDRDIKKAIMAITAHEKNKAEILAREQERLRREEEERIRREEREKIEAERRHQEELRLAEEKAKAEAEHEAIEAFIPVEVSGDHETVYEYHITLTEDAKEKLELFMNSVGIEFEIMPVF